MFAVPAGIMSFALFGLTQSKKRNMERMASAFVHVNKIKPILLGQPTDLAGF